MFLPRRGNTYFCTMKSTLVAVGLAILLVIGFNVGKKYFLKPRIEYGIKAFEINGNLPGGESFSLSDLKGKYVLLDFWGSWCKPCRKSNPKLVKLYQDFSARTFNDASGFDIVSFAVERNKESWFAAIMEDHLTWPYQLVSTDLFNDPTIKAYNVRQIPTKFLINPDGIIIAVDPALDEVREILEGK